MPRNKYYIGVADGSFNNDANWSSTSGGANDVTHPIIPTGTVNTNGTAVTWASGNGFTGMAGEIVINNVLYTISSVTDDHDLVLTTSAGVHSGYAYAYNGEVAVFDGGNSNNCAIDSVVACGGINIVSGYTAIVTQTAAITIGGVKGNSSGFSQADGTFTGGAYDITIYSGNFSLSGGAFTSSSHNSNSTGLVLINNIGVTPFTFTNSGGTFSHNGGSVVFTSGVANGAYQWTLNTGGTGAGKDISTLFSYCLNLASNISVAAHTLLQVTTGAFFNSAGFDYTNAGNFTNSINAPLTVNSGTWRVQGNLTNGTTNAATVAAGTSTLILGGAGGTHTTSLNYYGTWANVTVDNVTINSGYLLFSGTLTITGTGVVTNGMTFETSSATSLIAVSSGGSYSANHYVRGLAIANMVNWTSSGTFTPYDVYLYGNTAARTIAIPAVTSAGFFGSDMLFLNGNSTSVLTTFTFAATAGITIANMQIGDPVAGDDGLVTFEPTTNSPVLIITGTLTIKARGSDTARNSTLDLSAPSGGTLHLSVGGITTVSAIGASVAKILFGSASPTIVFNGLTITSSGQANAFNSGLASVEIVNGNPNITTGALIIQNFTGGASGNSCNSATARFIIGSGSPTISCSSITLQDLGRAIASDHDNTVLFDLGSGSPTVTSAGGITLSNAAKTMTGNNNVVKLLCGTNTAGISGLALAITNNFSGAGTGNTVLVDCSTASPVLSFSSITIKANGTTNAYFDASATNGGTLSVSGDIVANGTGAGTEYLKFGKMATTLGGAGASSFDMSGGSFDSGTGVVIFAGAGIATIGGANSWYDLTFGASKTHKFPASLSQAVTHALASNGALGLTASILTVVSGTTKWLLNLTGTSTLSNKVNVSYSDANAGAKVKAVHSVDGGNNLNWQFSSYNGSRRILFMKGA